MRLALEGAQEPRIQCANALEVGLELEERFDVVLANPPFGSRGKVNTPHLLQRYELGHRWQHAKQGWHPTHLLSPGQPPEILFIELCLRLLRPYGRMAIVLPDGILQNATTEHVRDWIRGRAELEAVVSLPQHTFVPYGTGIKTSLLLLRKHPAQPHQVFMAVPQKIGYDVKGQPLYLRDCDGKVMHDPRGKPIVDSELPSIARLFHQAETAVPNLLAF
ncbi:MAG: N-6 DNA methylase [bacterium]|nr:N-6 DNA methylase [bacterium]